MLVLLHTFSLTKTMEFLRKAAGELLSSYNKKIGSCQPVNLVRESLVCVGGGILLHVTRNPKGFCSHLKTG